MSSQFKVISYSLILLFLPITSQAEVNIHLSVPGFGFYKHHAYSHNKRYYKPRANYRHNGLTSVLGNKHNRDRANYYANKYRNKHSRPNHSNRATTLYGNKHDYDRTNYYRNKYGNNFSNSRRYNNAYAQGFNDGRRTRKHNNRHKYHYGK